MPKPASTRPAYKMLTCIYLCRTLLFFAPYADFFTINLDMYFFSHKRIRYGIMNIFHADS